MSIVTKQGDKGTTRLFSGEEIPKDNQRVETYGTVDELVSFMGLARSFCVDRKVSDDIQDHQSTLFRLASELATIEPSKMKIDPIHTKDIETIELLLSEYEQAVTLPPHFIIPGGGKSSAFLDVCRTICRRLERLLVRFSKGDEWNNQDALIYINRLSDLLFMMARKEEE